MIFVSNIPKKILGKSPETLVSLGFFVLSFIRLYQIFLSTASVFSVILSRTSSSTGYDRMPAESQRPTDTCAVYLQQRIKTDGALLFRAFSRDASKCNIEQDH